MMTGVFTMHNLMCIVETCACWICACPAVKKKTTGPSSYAVKGSGFELGFTAKKIKPSYVGKESG